MPPLAAPAAESVWSTSLLEGVNLVSASKQSDTAPAKAAEHRLSQYGGHNRRGAVSIHLETGSGLRPAQPPDFGGNLDSAVFRPKLLSGLAEATIPHASHVPGHRDVVDSDQLPSLPGYDIPKAAVHRVGRPENRIAMLKEVLQ